QNFNKKLKRETVTLDELKAIADVLGVRFEQAFVLPDGDEIKISNE
ncbi:helix-turn-helix domain-containing protein, partial [Streptococcus parasuis]